MANRRRRKSNNKAKIVIAIALILTELLVFLSGYFVGVHMTKKTIVTMLKRYIWAHFVWKKLLFVHVLIYNS